MRRTAKDLKAVYGELQERLNQNIGRQIKALGDNESSDLLVTEEERIDDELTSRGVRIDFKRLRRPPGVRLSPYLWGSTLDEMSECDDDPELEVCPECDGAATWDSCLCKGNGVIPKRPEQLSLFAEEQEESEADSAKIRG